MWAASIFERINIAGFFIQETILSSIYLWKCRALLGHYVKARTRATGTSRTEDSRESNSVPIVRSILFQLIMVNVVILCLDVTLIVLEVSPYGIFPFTTTLSHISHLGGGGGGGKRRARV